MELISSLMSAIISAIVSFIVGILFSDKSVERSQLRRHHSITLQASLTDWSNKINEICKMRRRDQLFKYSHEKEKLVPIEIDDLKSKGVPHHQFIESHLISGYTDVWVQWNNLLQQEKDYADKTTELTENIRQQFVSQSRELNLVEYYSRPRALERN